MEIDPNMPPLLSGFVIIKQGLPEIRDFKLALPKGFMLPRHNRNTFFFPAEYSSIHLHSDYSPVSYLFAPPADQIGEQKTVRARIQAKQSAHRQP